MSFSKKQDSIKIIVILLALLINLIEILLLLLPKNNRDFILFVKEEKPSQSAPVFFQPVSNPPQKTTTIPSQISLTKNKLPAFVFNKQSVEESKKIDKQSKLEEEIRKIKRVVQKNIELQKKENLVQISKKTDTQVMDLDTKKEEKKIQKTESETKMEHKKQLQRTSLSDFAKSFLNYARLEEEHYALTQKKTHGRTNLISYVNAQDGIPTEEQLKHERYIQKIFKQLNISFKIKGRNFLPPKNDEPFFVANVELLLNQNGNIDNIKLIKSSGFQEFDIFLINVLKDASSAFPPVPKYFNVDQYFLPIQFNIASNFFNH